MGALLLFTAILITEPDHLLRYEPGSNPAEIKLIAQLPKQLLAQVPEGKLDQDAGERLLQLSLIKEDGKLGPPMLGRYERSKDALTFVPRFNLEAGKSYRARLLLDPKGEPLQRDYQVPLKKFDKPAIISAIYPATDEVPANLLKFYIHFSKPMREGKDIFEHFRLIDDNDKPVEDPWRRTELWNVDNTRLTLWIHPGRIKKGVNLREEIGPVLEPRRRYRLVIDEKLLDGDGQPLGKEFSKFFRTTDAISQAIAVNDWKLQAPTKVDQSLEVRFPRLLDRALLDRMLVVMDSKGKAVAGKISVSDQEKRWTFQPEKDWAIGDYTLVVDPQLEDLAGNTLLRPFDFDRKLPENKEPVTTLKFRVK